MSQPASPAAAHKSFMGRIFMSGQGLRPGWSLAIFLSIYSALTLGAHVQLCDCASFA